MDLETVVGIEDQDSVCLTEISNGRRYRGVTGIPCQQLLIEEAYYEMGSEHRRRFADSRRRSYGSCRALTSCPAVL